MSGGSPPLLAKLADLENDAQSFAKTSPKRSSAARQATALRPVTAKVNEAHWEFFATTAHADVLWARTTPKSVVARIEYDANAETLRIN